MEQEILYGNITIIPNGLGVFDDKGMYPYDVENVTGLQVCFECNIRNDECDN